MTGCKAETELVDVKELLERDRDFLREALVQAAQEGEMTEAIAAEKGERTPARLTCRERRTRRNGRRTSSILRKENDLRLAQTLVADHTGKPMPATPNTNGTTAVGTPPRTLRRAPGGVASGIPRKPAVEAHLMLPSRCKGRSYIIMQQATRLWNRIDGCAIVVSDAVAAGLSLLLIGLMAIWLTGCAKVGQVTLGAPVTAAAMDAIEIEPFSFSLWQFGSKRPVLAVM
jgi:hypothetical protein